jgi:mono/diheme cytochrome c family protein
VLLAETSTQQSIAIVIAVLLTIALVLLVFGNMRRARPEVGSEIELAPNRKPYLNDEELEGSRLDQALRWGLLALVITGVGLPLYWLFEPTRQENETEQFDQRAISDNEELAGGAFLFAPTEEGGFNCAGCHGPEGVGGVTDFTLTEPVLDANGDPVLDKDGKPKEEVRVVKWAAPPLNTVLKRFSPDEVRNIITYGRENTPMPAWGLAGGGPMNEQMVNNLVAYIGSIQISDDEQKEQAETQQKDAIDSGDYDNIPAENREGAALFDLFCSRCHTFGWSYGEPGPRGGGAFGPNLLGGATKRQFPVKEDHITFVTEGSNFEEGYGQRGIGSGRMPGFGRMLTKEQIEAIVDYERTL